MQHVFQGTTAPTITPTAIGQHYIDTIHRVPYISTGTTDPTDWKISASMRVPLVIAHYTSSFSVTGEDIMKTDGTNAITATLPSAVGFTRTITFNHSGTQDLTISGGTINNDPTGIKLRGNHINSVTLYSDGSNWWTT